MRVSTIFLTAMIATTAAWAQLPRSTAPDGASVRIIEPIDGDTVPTTFRVVFGLSGMGVAPAGVDTANTGHHHLIIDSPLPQFDQPIGGEYKHFGGGQTETELTLEPGTHTLQLLLGDKLHIPQNPPVYSQKITVHVE